MLHSISFLARAYWFGATARRMSADTGTGGGNSGTPQAAAQSGTPVAASSVVGSLMAPTPVQTQAEPELMALLPKATRDHLLSGLGGEASPPPAAVAAPAAEDASAGETEIDEAEAGDEGEESGAGEAAAGAGDDTASATEAGEGEEAGDGAPTAEELAAENAELKAKLEAAPQPIAPVIVPGSPLSHVQTSEQLKGVLLDAKAAKEWAFDHLSEGGELPQDLVAALTGADPSQAQPMTLTPQEARELYKRSDKMITELVPARAQHLQVEQATIAGVQKQDPDAFKATTEMGKLVGGIIKQVPQLLTHPQWAAFASDWARGYLARTRAEAAAKGKAGAVKTVKTGNGKTVPLAPNASVGGRRTTVRPDAKVSAETKAAAGRALNGKGTQKDILALLKVAT